MTAPRHKPLLAPGNEDEWARINEEKAREEAEFAASLSMNERVSFGQKLSQQGGLPARRLGEGRPCPQNELSGPDLDGVIADANAADLPYVVIGGFSVYETVAAEAIKLDRQGEPAPFGLDG
ncbi:MAG: hypothetical protein ACJ75T_07400 [Solirubrobacterales bacterium]